MDFTGTPIYDVYEDERCTTLGCNFCREPRHKSDMKSQGGDNSSQDNVLSPIFIQEIHDMSRNSFLGGSELGRYYKNLADGVPDGEEFLDQNGFHSFIDASRTTGTRDINLTTGTSHCGTSLGAHSICFELPWTYGRRTSCDSFGNTYGFAFRGKHINLFPREETMDPEVPKEEYLSLYSPLCLYNSATFRPEAKLFGDVQFMDVM
ncbi:hypothetical protein HID58_079526 [Brassica napus]|uniref:Uncharacterized protein n=1 Tax=Brassica napus TaxID=3708 RepID=A0ABQ7Y289_BRANA|nr:hypothetical protein HID58_079526 [Brassica napus]